MISGVHALIFARDADKVRAFFRDVLGFSSVDAGGGWLKDAGGGWLIFALPPAELGIHPTDGDPHHELYLMCDDIHASVAALEQKGVQITRAITEQRFGLTTAIRLPDGGELALYQPSHPTALTG